MADETEIDLIDLIAPKTRGKRAQKPPVSLADAPDEIVRPQPLSQQEASSRTVFQADAPEGRIEVRPIGTPLGLKELGQLHKKTWSTLNVQEKRVHTLLWPLALHFGLYLIKPGQEKSGRR